MFCLPKTAWPPTFRNLADGDRVEFEVTRGPKGLSATQVRKI